MAISCTIDRRRWSKDWADKIKDERSEQCIINVVQNIMFSFITCVRSLKLDLIGSI